MLTTPLHNQKGDGVDAKSVRCAEPGTLMIMPDVLWDRTKRVSVIIAPLSARAIVGRAARRCGVLWSRSPVKLNTITALEAN